MKYSFFFHPRRMGISGGQTGLSSYPVDNYKSGSIKKKKHNCKAGYIHSCGHGASKDSAFQTSDEAWFLYPKSNSCSFSASTFSLIYRWIPCLWNLFIYQFFVPIVIYFYSHPGRFIPSNIFLSRNDIVLSF